MRDSALGGTTRVTLASACTCRFKPGAESRCAARAVALRLEQLVDTAFGCSNSERTPGYSTDRMDSHAYRFLVLLRQPHHIPVL
eukprot:scaffold1410_cov148-Isochrysis_galbana.AAC.3